MPGERWMNAAMGLLLALGIGSAGCAGPGAGIRDPVSAGSAKLLLEAGKTTQAEVLEAFGGPSIVTGDAAGHETWTYDRMAYTVSQRSGE